MVAALAAGCGARTGLRVPSVSQDASVFIDVPVFADVPDAACPGDGLVAPRVLALASAHAALAVAPEWSTPRAANTADGAGWTLAAPADGVAALVAATAALSLVDLAAFAEDAVVAATGAVPVLVGRHGSVAGGWTLQRSVFRVAQPGTAAALRDRVGAALHLASGPADAGFATASAFTVEVTTALRADRPADAARKGVERLSEGAHAQHTHVGGDDDEDDGGGRAFGPQARSRRRGRASGDAGLVGVRVLLQAIHAYDRCDNAITSSATSIRRGGG